MSFRGDVLLDADALAAVVRRLAHEIADRVAAEERGPLRIDAHGLAIVGIRTGGAHLAHRLARELQRLLGREIPTGVLDITLYRDDVLVGGTHKMPVLRGTEIPFDVDGRFVVLVDDVLFTGRTIRAALGALLDLGRPACVRLAVLVDRGLRELPIGADFVGREIASDPSQHVEVRLVEEGAERDEVVLLVPENRRKSDGSGR